ncbi:MAG: murein L,D-transpeptidase [Burkholderiales bacterium]
MTYLRWRASLLATLLIATGTAFADSDANHDGIAAIATAFEREVDKKLAVPSEEQAGYAGALRAALARAGKEAVRPEFVLLVDRSPAVQAAFLYSISAEDWRFIGASPVATGLPGAYEHFLTPLGVFEHSVTNMDFRAEGTANDLGIRGYGLKGMRIFDFGWVMGERGWGGGGMSPMRLEMHATDPALERLLGMAHSEGCVRIPATLDRFLDHHGILDVDYERAATLGMHLTILLPDREPTPWAGRYLVIIDSERSKRPAWSPFPGRQAPHLPSSLELDAPRSGVC